MFLIIGVNDGRKDFNFSQMTVCEACGAYGRYMVFMTFTALSLFFLPILKWNKRYFVQSSCCGTVYALDGEVGARIARGEDVEIRPEHLQPVRQGRALRRCINCGYSTDQDFEFCPKCGSKL